MLKRKDLLLLLTGAVLAVVFLGAGYLSLKLGKGLVLKAKQKLQERYIANLPKAKEQLVISDFEAEQDKMKWEFGNAKGEVSQEHAASGNNSLKLTYLPVSGSASAKIEKYFEQNKQVANWAGYEVLSFEIFNPNPQRERMILQIKDVNGERSKMDLYLDPNVNNRMEVDIQQLWNSIKSTHIAQLNLFLWDNRTEKVFYLDNLRLLPENALQKHNLNIVSQQFLPKPGEQVYATGDYFAFKSAKWQKTDAQTNLSFIEIPLMLGAFLRGNSIEFPFCGGIPFAKGQLKSLDNIELTDAQGKEIPSQAKIMAYWPDKSIKWALLDLRSTLASATTPQYYLRYGENIKKQNYTSNLKLQDNPDEIKVDTGAISFSLSKHNFSLFDRVWIDDSKLISSGGDLILAHDGKEYHSNLDKNSILTIEENGPLKICLKAEGWFVAKNGDKFCRYIVRIYAYENSPYLKVQHTFIYTGYPENKVHYLYKGKRLPKNETIEGIYLKTPFNLQGESKITFLADEKVMQGELPQSVEILQTKFDAYSVKKYLKEINSGRQLSGWLDLSSGKSGISIGVKNFWQQFPKGFLIDRKNQCLVTYLWPKQAGVLDLKTTKDAYGTESVARGSAFGLAKTHEMFFYFHKGDYKESSARNVATVLNTDLFVCARPQWISNTRVIGRVWPYDNRIGSAEDFLSRLFDWGERQIKNFHWYGMIDFGDTLSWYRKDGYEDDDHYDDWGWHAVGRWGWFNCEAVGTHTGALIQFLRTGDYKYFKFGANLARHIMDIDTCHYNTVANDKRLKKVIPDDYSQVGSMHRHNANHWGDRNEETSHTNVYGLILYYYITGDARARDVIEEVGDFFLKGRVTYFKHPDIAPLRSIANALWGEVDLYELTGEQKFKEAADKWASLIYAGQKQNGAWSEDYNPVRNRWEKQPHLGYISDYALPALIAYHQLTGNKAIAECITKATDFVIKNEEYGSYFDASAYSYWITGDKKYLNNLQNRLDFTINHQQHSDDPLWDGMIYQKAIYGRVMEYLYKTPFAFEVLANE